MSKLSQLEVTILQGHQFDLGDGRRLRVKVEVGFEDPITGADPAELESLGETEACLTSLHSVNKQNIH